MRQSLRFGRRTTSREAWRIGHVQPVASVNVNGAALECREAGSGQAFVLVHGSASDYRTWHLQEEAFADRFRVISYSRRYHWPNDPVPEANDYSMVEQAADLAALVRSRDAAPAHLIGHSYGAFLCLLVALQEPSLVRTLVLAEPPVLTLFVSSTPKPLELLRLAATRPRTAAAIIKFGATGVAPAMKAFRRNDVDTGIRKYAEAVFGPEGFEGLSPARKQQVLDNLPNVKAEVLGSGFAPLDPDALRNMEVPTLLVTGGTSIALFHHLAERVGELLPKVERVEIPEASHMIHEDNAPAFNRAVRIFLDKHGAAA